MYRILTYSFIVFVAMACAFTSCSTRETKEETPHADSVAAETYHADNDIAMTVRSLADALSQGEPLDSADYYFEGVLTDGQGYPLYTDIQGGPGVWEVMVLSPSTAVIRNLYLGDLFPDDLRHYVMQNLGLDEATRINTDDFIDDDQTSVDLYETNGVQIRFETRSAVAPNGLEGPLMSIILKSAASR